MNTERDTMKLKNVSSPIRTQGSDLDLELSCNPTEFHIVSRTLTAFGIGTMVRNLTYRVAVFNIELYIIDATRPDEITQAVHNNHNTMMQWDNETRSRYRTDKLAISHLAGDARKRAKARLAEKHGLNPCVYDICH